MGWFVWLVVLFLLYCAASFVLLRFPLSLWSRVRGLSFPVAHIAHRGGSEDAPENTLGAFRSAWLTHDVDVLELDVRWTRDQQIVILHDDSFERTAGVNKRCGDLNYDELPKIHGSAPVCRLIDLLDDAELKDAPICLDLKVHNDVRLIDEVYELFRARKRLDKLVWGSFSEPTRRLCVARHPDVPTFMSLQATALLYVSFLVGLLPFVPLNNSSCGVLLCTVLLREEWFNAFINSNFDSGFLRITMKILAMLGPNFFTWAIEHPMFIAHLTKRGINVCFWTVNTEDDVKRIGRSASGIVTDFPSKKLHTRLNSFTKKNKQ